MNTTSTKIKNSFSASISFKKASGIKALGLAILLSTGLNGFAQEGKKNKVNIGLVYPVSTNGTHAALDTNVFSLNALVGV